MASAADAPRPEVAAILDRLDDLGGPPPWEVSLDRARSGFDALPVHRPAEPTPLAAVRDVEVPGDDGDLPARVYRPTTAESRPVVVYFHGGGWVLGSLDSHDETCRVLAAESGCVVVSVDYRLAPEHPFPAPVADACAATAWVAEHADAVGGDGRLAVAGDSAGGALAAAVALRDRDLPGGLGGDERAADDADAAAVDHQTLVYPATSPGDDWPSRVANGEEYGLSRAEMRWFGEQYFAHDLDRHNRYAFALEARDLSGLPPASVVTCGLDPLRDEGVALAERLDTAGVATRHHHYPALVHGVANWLGEWQAAAAREVLGDVAGDLRAQFGLTDDDHEREEREERKEAPERE
jgi:acetyl esterase